MLESIASSPALLPHHEVAGEHAANPADVTLAFPPPALRVTLLGHATALIDMGGVRVLTDPVFDSRLSLFPLFGARITRTGAPVCRPETLPHLDAVLVTHAHPDHLSFDSLARLPRGIPVYAPPGLVGWMTRRARINAVGLAPGESTCVESLEHDTVTITAGAAKHSGARFGIDLWHAATNFYLLDNDDTSCFFAGDTALTHRAKALVDARLRSLGRRLDLAILPISYAPWWHPGLRSGHLTWQDALALVEELDARALVPCHWGAFSFPDSGPFDAIERLRRALGAYVHADRVRILDPGDHFELASARRSSAAS